MTSVRPRSQALPPPTTPAAKTAWDAANLTSAEIARRHDPSRFQAFHWRRHPDVATALRFALGSLVLPLVGPLAWQIARAELAAIEAGLVSPRGRHWIAFARVVAIVSTCALATAIVLMVT
jgi:hypothetical protein